MKLTHLILSVPLFADFAIFGLAQAGPAPAARQALPAGSQAGRASEAPPYVISPEVNPDGRVTFRFRDPNAKEVNLNLEGNTRHLPMQLGEHGIWSVTTDPLEPDFYGYSFVADGIALIDPANSLMKPNLLSTQSMVRVPGAGLPWEITDVPRGTIHHHFYRSAVVGDDRDYYVYTPPGYDPAATSHYPVLYLLHGYSDDASGWTAVGRAQVIMDNLIAQGKAKPMIVVMPVGYGAPEIVTRGWAGIGNPIVLLKNMERFRDVLLSEVIP